jgi:L-glyceraldehyde 3-phosphate reductase
MNQVWNNNRYEKMQYRPCGKWGLKLSIISIGAWQTVGGYEEADVARDIFYRAFDQGITHFDFANGYGSPPGRAEEMGGQILRDLPRDEIVISTKAGYRAWDGPYGDGGNRKYIIASCERSLQRMGLDYFDIFYHHRPDLQTPLEETHGAIETLIRQGKVLYAGVSGYYSPERSEETVLLKEAKGWSPLTVQMQNYSLLERPLEGALLQTARRYGFGLIAYSPLARGLLSDKYLHGIPAASRAAKGGVALPDEAEMRKIRALHEMAVERGQSLAQMSLAWVLRLPEIATALTAFSTVEQLRDTLQVLDRMSFSEQELAHIDAILNDEEGAAT